MNITISKIFKKSMYSPSKRVLSLFVSVLLVAQTIVTSVMVLAAEKTSLPINFELNNPIEQISNIYSGADHYTTEGFSVVSDDAALNGEHSFKIDILDKNDRTDTKFVSVSGIKDFSKSDFSKITGIMLRLKLENDKGTAAHNFTLVFQQSGMSYTILGKMAKAYDVYGNSVNITSGNAGAFVPAGFDGFIFLPFSGARSEKVTVPGTYDSYQQQPQSMVDLSKEFNLMIRFGDSSWRSISAYIDDICVYSGEEGTQHLAFLKNLGYEITAVAQPSKYNYPMSFDDKIMPFNSINNIFSNAEHITPGGVSLVGGEEALNGELSVKVDAIKSGNSRTELTKTQMAPIEEAKNVGFYDNYGIMLRLKIAEDKQNNNHYFNIKLNQDGVSEPTFLGRGAKAYDLDGNEIKLNNANLCTAIPAGFDGFLFLPFVSAQSNKVTEPGFYDTYAKHPESMVDVSKNYFMTITFGRNDGDTSWSNCIVYLDDMTMYKGSKHSEHIETINALGYNTTAVVQPSEYSYPMHFDDKIMPFNTVNDVYANAEHIKTGGVSLVGGDKALNGELSVKVDAIRDGNTRTELTRTQMAAITDIANAQLYKNHGILLRLKITDDKQKDDHYFSIRLHQSGVSQPTCLGNGAKAYDLDGNKISLNTSNLTARIPAGFDGFIFLPLNTAQSQTVTVPGMYDTYDAQPQSMVDLTKAYTMTVMFGSDGGDNTWSGCTVYLDDIALYSGNEHSEHIKALNALGYETTAVVQPSKYSYPMSFDDKIMPFTSVNDVYDNAEHITTGGVSLIGGKEALNGTLSVKVDAINKGNSRTELTRTQMAAITGVKNDELYKNYGLLLRLKITGDKQKDDHFFSIRFTQNGVAQPTCLGRGAIAYDLSGKEIALNTSNLVASIPAGFDGFIFLPLATAQSRTVTVPGMYDAYDAQPQSMVDLTKDYTMTVMFGSDAGDNTWGDCIVYFDDMVMYSGNDHESHLKILRNLGYKVTAVAQPSKYSFPMVFDDNIMPFNAVNNVYDREIHWSNSGVSLIGGKESLNGKYSVKIDSVRKGNSRTELNNVSMAGIKGFSKNDFSKVTGIMLRIKLSGGDSTVLKKFTISARQDKLFTTHLGRNAVAYDLKGNKITLQDVNLGVNLPGNFNGYLFIPFANAQSEQVTVPGTYDNYKDFPKNLVDFSKDYTMQIVLNEENWDTTTVIIDDMRVYSGEEYINILKKYYSGIVTVQQPLEYGFPVDFESGMTPFTFELDGGKWALKGEYGTGASLSYTTLSSGKKGISIDFADDLTDAYSVFTSKAKFKAPEGQLGFLLRIKTDAKAGATLGIVTDNLQDNCVQFGKASLLFDLNGNPVDPPAETNHWLGCNIPAEFDGFAFIPYANGFIERQQKFISNIPAWKMESTARDLQIIFYGEKQWQGANCEIEFFGTYADKNYLGTLEALGFSLNAEKGMENREILGEASNLFFYMQRLNEGFDEKDISKLKKWNFINSSSKKYLAGHYPENISLENGSLYLQYRKENKNGQKYTAGAIRTTDLCTYGYYEASLKLPKLSGTKSVFRIVTEGGYENGGTAFEVDIAYLNEQYKLANGYKYMSDYKALKDGGKLADGAEKVQTSNAYNDELHTYGLLYTYNYLRFYVDGVLVREIENSFARGGVYIEIAGEVISDITDTLTDDNSSIAIDYVRYWEIDKDEMSKYDTVKLLNSTGADNSANSKIIKVNTTSKGLLVTVCILGIIDLIAVVLLAVFAIKRRRG